MEEYTLYESFKEKFRAIKQMKNIYNTINDEDMNIYFGAIHLRQAISLHRIIIFKNLI